MNQKDHILRLAVGAHRLNVPFDHFIEGLNLYVQDETAIDRQPLLGWFNFGGDDVRGNLGVSLVHGAMRELYLKDILNREQGHG